MGTQNRPIACQVVKIVHDDSNKQINNLGSGKLNIVSNDQCHIKSLYFLTSLFLLTTEDIWV